MKGRLVVKNGEFYGVVSYKDVDGKFKQKWITTNLKERGNKKNAQKILDDYIRDFENGSLNPENEQDKKFAEIQSVKLNNEGTKDILFVDYIEDYIHSKEKELAPIVYQTYLYQFKIIKEYFGNTLKLKDVTYKDIENFYHYLRYERNNKNTTIKHHKNIIAPALKIAYRDDLIPKNPFDFLPKLKKEKSSNGYYNKDELENLFKITDETHLGLIVRVAAYYGFRRSELIGLKWNAIDFSNKTITIQHKIVEMAHNLYLDDKLKTEASKRTLPLFPDIEKRLLIQKENIEKNKRYYSKIYNAKYLDYVFVNEIGDLIRPDKVSKDFAHLIQKNHLKYIRFHDLRHSCASLLVANGVQMKAVQQWLGHANFNTTADTYSHLDYSAKEHSAIVISNALENNEEEKSDEEILEEIEALQKLLEEKKSKLKKKSEMEM